MAGGSYGVLSGERGGLAGVITARLRRKKGVVDPSFQLGTAAASGGRQWLARLFNNLPHVAWMPDTKVLDAVMASAAAPVFFPPHDVPRAPGANAFIDGGVFANNPS